MIKLAEETKKEAADLCMCGYRLRKDGEYANAQHQIVSLMVCDSCGAIEHWIENVSSLLEVKSRMGEK